MRRLKRLARLMAPLIAALVIFNIYSLLALGGHDFEAHFIDVGQGDCILIKCGGESLLIDAGTPDSRDTIRQYLTGQGIDRLDSIVATHGHADHVGAMAMVIEEFTPRRAYISHHVHPTNTYMRVLEALDSAGAVTEAPEAGDSFTVGEAVCTFVGVGEGFEEANNSSLVLMVDYKGRRLLFTGDMEKDAEAVLLERGVDLSAAVLKAGHHGSDTSSSQEFLDAVNPHTVIISVGKGNDYGHPHREVLERLAGKTVYRTDRDGTVVVWWDEDASGIEREK